MNYLWNFTNPIQSGHVRLASFGKELYGTVIRAGRMKKTVTVRNLRSK